jgi:hypothetical protein
VTLLLGLVQKVIIIIITTNVTFIHAIEKLFIWQKSLSNFMSGSWIRHTIVRTEWEHATYWTTEVSWVTYLWLIDCLIGCLLVVERSISVSAIFRTINEKRKIPHRQNSSKFFQYLLLLWLALQICEEYDQRLVCLELWYYIRDMSTCRMLFQWRCC